MKPEQIDLAQRAYAEIRKAEVPVEGILTDKDLHAALASAGIINGSIDPVSRSLVGFTLIGLREVERLAASIRAMTPHGPHEISNATLSRRIRGMLIGLWRNNAGAETKADDIRQIGGLIDAWNADQRRVRTHFVPCNLSCAAWPRFSIGPVLFYPLTEAPPVPEFSVAASLQEDALNAARARGHFWIAEIEVRGREQSQSIQAADQSVDVALGIYQLLLNNSEFAGVARANGLGAPMLRSDYWSQDGDYVGARSVVQPGRSYHPKVIADIIAVNSAILDSMGRRLSGYHHGTSTLPLLDATWCNATYWFHATLAEPLETIALVGFETAVEVLLANSNGSSQRIIDAFAKLLGMQADAPVGTTGLNVKDFSNSLVTARSRVLHGSWPTLHPDMPGATGQIAIGRASAETLVRSLLLRMSEAIDLYAVSLGAVDTIPSFLAWCGDNLPSASILNRVA